MTTESIHKLANSLGVSWDGDPHFMNWCHSLVGKKHLDDMSEGELLKVYMELKNGRYPKLYVKEVKDMDYLIREFIKDMKRNTRK